MSLSIIGIHDFEGSNLVKALKAKHTIYGLDITSQHKAGVDVDVVLHSRRRDVEILHWQEKRDTKYNYQLIY